MRFKGCLAGVPTATLRTVRHQPLPFFTVKWSKLEAQFQFAFQKSHSWLRNLQDSLNAEKASLEFGMLVTVLRQVSEPERNALLSAIKFIEETNPTLNEATFAGELHEHLPAYLASLPDAHRIILLGVIRKLEEAGIALLESKAQPNFLC